MSISGYRAAITAVLLLLTLRSAAAVQVILVPGWYSEWVHYARHRELLNRTFPAAEVEVFKWNSNRLWKNAKISASECAAVLAQKLKDSPERENTVLIGHSLGGRIVMECAVMLAAQQLKVKQIILIGCAGVPDAGKVAAVQKISRDAVINIFCLDDNMLKLYIGKENELPLGFSGFNSRMPHLRQFRMFIDESDVKLGKVTVIRAETLETVRETIAHLSMNYLQTLHDAVTGKLSECYLDYAAAEACAGEQQAAPDKIPGFRQVDTFDNWTLEKRTFKCRFRITAPSGRQFFYDDEQTAKSVFAGIKKYMSATIASKGKK